MTRFEMELSGQLGDYWKKDALAKIAKIENDYETGKLTITDGVARWTKVGRCIPKDCFEILMNSKYAYLAVKDAHFKALDIETTASIERYRKSMENHVYTEEELGEMRNAFGSGVVVDVITGRKIRL